MLETTAQAENEQRKDGIYPQRPGKNSGWEMDNRFHNNCFMG
jgi:hypothetical protein